MEGAALDGGDALAHHGVAAVDEPRLHRAVLERDGRDVGRVRLVGLGQVGGVGVDGEPLLGEPGHGAAGVEAAGECDPECGALRGKRLVDAAHGLATYHPRIPCATADTSTSSRWTRPAPGGRSSTTCARAGNGRRKRSGGPGSRRVRSGWTAPSRPPGNDSAPASDSPGIVPRGTSRRPRPARRCSSRTGTSSPWRSPAAFPPFPGEGCTSSRRCSPWSGAATPTRSRFTGWGATPPGSSSSPGPRTPGWSCSGPCGSGASGRCTGRSARAIPRATPSTSTPPSARSPTRPPERSTRPPRTAAPRAASCGSWSGGRGRRRRRSSRWRSRPAGPTRSASTWPSPATRSWGIPSTARAGCPSRAAPPCRAIRATTCTPGGSSSRTRAAGPRSRWNARRRRSCEPDASGQWPIIGAIR